MSIKKKTALILTPLLGATVLTGCGEEPTTRDVYQSQEECLRDWNDGELCQSMPDDDDYRKTHGVHGPIFWGPTYYPHDRTVVYKGRTISPVTKSSSMKSYSVTSRSSASARTSAASPRSVSTGGFGGRSTGGSFGS